MFRLAVDLLRRRFWLHLLLMLLCGGWLPRGDISLFLVVFCSSWIVQIEIMGDTIGYVSGSSSVWSTLPVRRKSIITMLLVYATAWSLVWSAVSIGMQWLDFYTGGRTTPISCARFLSIFVASWGAIAGFAMAAYVWRRTALLIEKWVLFLSLFTCVALNGCVFLFEKQGNAWTIHYQVTALSLLPCLALFWIRRERFYAALQQGVRVTRNPALAEGLAQGCPGFGPWWWERTLLFRRHLLAMGVYALCFAGLTYGCLRAGMAVILLPVFAWTAPALLMYVFLDLLWPDPRTQRSMPRGSGVLLTERLSLASLAGLSVSLPMVLMVKGVPWPWTLAQFALPAVGVSMLMGAATMRYALLPLLVPSAALLLRVMGSIFDLILPVLFHGGLAKDIATLAASPGFHVTRLDPWLGLVCLLFGAWAIQRQFMWSSAPYRKKTLLLRR